MRSRGFTLIELTISLIILSLIGGIFISMAFSIMGGQRASTTRAKLSAIDAALVSFVAINRRLPCPADGRLAAGTEVSPCVTQAHGVVPWVSLGLSAQDIEDGWNNRITYRTDARLTNANAMDLSGCDPAGTAGTATLVAPPPNSTCVSTSGPCSAATLANCVRPQLVLLGKGLEIRDPTIGAVVMNPGADPATGAAYILISHGENQAGAYSNSGSLLDSSNGVTGTNEAHNSAALSQAFFYVDMPQNFSTTGNRFDDFVLRPSVLSVIQRAHLGPRSH